MHPAVHYQDFHLGEEHQPHAEATAIIETLKSRGQISRTDNGYGGHHPAPLPSEYLS